MATPQKHSLPVTNDPTSHGTRTPWYRVPVVWIGIFLTLLIMAGLLHLIIVSHNYSGQTALPATATRDLNRVLGVPLARESKSTSTPAQQDTAQKP